MDQITSCVGYLVKWIQNATFSNFRWTFYIVDLVFCLFCKYSDLNFNNHIY